MTGILFLIPIAIGLGLLGLVGFFWSLKSGQFDDMDGAALRILIASRESGNLEVDDGGRGAPAGPRQRGGEVDRVESSTVGLIAHDHAHGDSFGTG